jgi:DNA-binding FadR family transcriptional regulator
MTELQPSSGSFGGLLRTQAGSDDTGERPRSRKTSERVANDIVHDIVDQGLHPGDRLPLEAAMIEQYDVSRASLREALRLLEVQGLIRLKPGPGGGPAVGTVEARNLAQTASLYFHLGAATYHDLLRAQTMLEPMCALLASTNPNRAAAMRPFWDGSRPDGHAEHHREAVAFHRAVYDLAANPVVSLLTEAITFLVTTHVMASQDPVEMHGAIVDEHRAIAMAVAEGDGADAQQLMAVHFSRQHDFYRRTFPARLTQYIEWR